MNNATINLADYAPVIATKPASKVTEKYRFIPTTRLVEILADHGWHPVQVDVTRTRFVEREGYQRHLIRFANDRWGRAMDGTTPHILLTNDHSGSAAFQFLVGLLEAVCSNGLVISNGDLSRFRVLHRGYQDGLIEEALARILPEIPRTLAKVDEYKHLDLSREDQREFARQAIELRFDGEKYSVEPDQVLMARRREQRTPTLWNTFNVVQEAVIRGGIRQVRADNSRIVSRPVTSIPETLRLNRELWTLTERTAAELA